jgi:hypothetical protein
METRPTKREGEKIMLGAITKWVGKYPKTVITVIF